jgi:hypothetical protein
MKSALSSRDAPANAIIPVDAVDNSGCQAAEWYRNDWWHFATVFILSWFILILPAIFRFVAADEGFYLSAARLVSEGKTPYLDFFYPQTPLLPYFYGIFFSIWSPSWLVARLVTAGVSATLATLLYGAVWRKASLTRARWALLLFLCTGMVPAWFLVAKAYALPTLLLFVSTLLYERSNSPRAGWIAFGSGLAGGLAVGCRLLLVPAVAVLGLATLFQKNRQTLIGFGAGIAVSLVPSLILFALQPDIFHFNNLGYHSLRSELSGLTALTQKLEVVINLFWPTIERDGGGIQFLLLVGGVLLFLAQIVRRTRESTIYVPLICTLFIVHLIPTPSWVQYFSHLIPFMLVIGATALPSPRQAKTWVGRGSLRVFLALVIGIYLGTGLIYYYRYLISGQGVRGISSKVREESRSVFLDNLGDRLNDFVPAGVAVLTVWPGYLVSSHAAYLSGFENQFWLRVGDQLTDQERLRYKIAHRKDLAEAIATGRSPYFLLGKKRTKLEERSLAAGSYQFLEGFGEVALYKNIHPH